MRGKPSRVSKTAPTYIRSGDGELLDHSQHMVGWRFPVFRSGRTAFKCRPFHRVRNDGARSSGEGRVLVRTGVLGHRLFCGHPSARTLRVWCPAGKKHKATCRPGANSTTVRPTSPGTLNVWATNVTIDSDSSSGRGEEFLDRQGDVVVDAGDEDLVDLLADVLQGDDRRTGGNLLRVAPPKAYSDAATLSSAKPQLAAMYSIIASYFSSSAGSSEPASTPAASSSTVAGYRPGQRQRVPRTPGRSPRGPRRRAPPRRRPRSRRTLQPPATPAQPNQPPAEAPFLGLGRCRSTPCPVGSESCRRLRRRAHGAEPER